MPNRPRSRLCRRTARCRCSSVMSLLSKRRSPSRGMRRLSRQVYTGRTGRIAGHERPSDPRPRRQAGPRRPRPRRQGRRPRAARRRHGSHLFGPAPDARSRSRRRPSRRTSTSSASRSSPAPTTSSCPKSSLALKERGGEGIAVVVGGIIPDKDIAPAEGQGVRDVFLPGTSTAVHGRRDPPPRGANGPAPDPSVSETLAVEDSRRRPASSRRTPRTTGRSRSA